MYEDPKVKRRHFLTDISKSGFRFRRHLGNLRTNIDEDLDEVSLGYVDHSFR